MREDKDLSALPEAVPLRSVAPRWRVLAILGLLASAGLLLAVAVLGAALLSDTNRFVPPAMAVPMPAPPPMVPGQPMPPGAAATLGLTDPADDPGGLPPDEGGVQDPRQLPYPIKADLAGAGRTGPAGPARDTAARRFLSLGQDVWRARKGLEPEHVAVSADGRFLAVAHAGKVWAGTVAQGPTLEVSGADAGGDGGPAEAAAGAPAGGPMPPPFVPDMSAGGPGLRLPPWPNAPEPPDVVGAPSRPVFGDPSWLRGAPVLYFSAAGDRPRRCRFEGAGTVAGCEALAVSGEAPAPVHTAPDRIVLVRSRSVPKVGVPGAPAADPTEVVWRDLGSREEKVVIPAGPAAWRHPAVEPDGTRVALVSDRGHEGRTPPAWRVFVVSLTGGEPQPVTPSAAAVGPVCWTPDGRALVYARSQDPAPADHAEEAPGSRSGTLDLYHLDLETRQETRLTRGGGFWAPSVDHSQYLCYLTCRGPVPNAGPVLRRVPLTAALDFAAREPEASARTAAAWQKLAEQVLAEAGVAADADGATLTPETPAKVAEAFARLYEKAFGRKPPADAEDLDRLRHELARLAVPRAAQPALRLVAGAATGDYLRRQHAARWKLGKGPLAPQEPAAATPTRESPFAAVFNPFDVPLSEKATPAAAGPWSLRANVLDRTEGRVLVLTNGPADESVRDLADPDLARGADLLRQGQAEEGERVLREMLQREPHKDNAHLALHVGRLLYEHQRFAALADLMKRWSRRQPLDARRLNLLGLAQLPANPQEAVGAFKSALRCDLQYGPAYLNLALAYQKTNNPAAAAQCLQRYLQLQPKGELAADARRRLGELQSAAAPGAGGPQ